MRRFSLYVSTVFRVVVGVLLLLHGLQRLMGGFAGGVPALIEVVGGGLVAAGVWTTPVALIAAAEVSVGYVLTHTFRVAWPAQTGAEVALLYVVSLLAIAKGR